MTPRPTRPGCPLASAISYGPRKNRPRGEGLQGEQSQGRARDSIQLHVSRSCVWNFNASLPAVRDPEEWRRPGCNQMIHFRDCSVRISAVLNPLWGPGDGTSHADPEGLQRWFRWPGGHGGAGSARGAPCDWPGPSLWSGLGLILASFLLALARPRAVVVWHGGPASKAALARSAQVSRFERSVNR
jgi:hypothetical protein